MGLGMLAGHAARPLQGLLERARSHQDLQLPGQ